jgi:hypothetical protein
MKGAQLANELGYAYSVTGWIVNEMWPRVRWHPLVLEARTFPARCALSSVRARPSISSVTLARMVRVRSRLPIRRTPQLPYRCALRPPPVTMRCSQGSARLRRRSRAWLRRHLLALERGRMGQTDGRATRLFTSHNFPGPSHDGTYATARAISGGVPGAACGRSGRARACVQKTGGSRRAGRRAAGGAGERAPRLCGAFAPHAPSPRTPP